jgi:hypothetical protein
MGILFSFKTKYAMLYKNDGVYTLADNEIKAIEKQFHGKFPIRVMYPPDRVVKSRSKHNRLPDKPNSISFDLKATVKTSKGTEIWRYADSVITDQHGRKIYSPKKFRFNGNRMLERNDIELIYFLFKKSEYCLGGENQGKMNKFVFEDLVSDAERKAEKMAVETKIGIMLFGDKGLCIPEDRLRDIAKAYHINGIDNLTLAQVRIILNEQIHKSKDGPTRFFDMIDDDEGTTIRTEIQRAVDLKLLNYQIEKKTWFWKTKEGIRPVKGGKVPPNKNPNQALFDLYKGDVAFKDDLDAVLLTEEPKKELVEANEKDD